MNAVVEKLVIQMTEAMVDALDTVLYKEKAKEIVDTFLDNLENRIEESETKLDDLVGGSIIKLIRKKLNIPDEG